MKLILSSTQEDACFSFVMPSDFRLVKSELCTSVPGENV